MGSRTCYLRYVQNPKVRIFLHHEVPTILGRNRETGIEDLYVSRKQIECHADFPNKEVILKVVGQCYSGCNGYALLMNETYTLKDGDRIELRLGYHGFDIIFEDTDIENMNEKSPPKKKTKVVTGPFTFTNKGHWEEIDNKNLLIYTPENCPSFSKIASFDLDGTLIKTKSGNKFPRNFEDWQFLYSDLPTKLRKTFDDNYKIVIFTNQKPLKDDSSKASQFKKKIEAILSKLAIPVQVFVSTGVGIYRKPAPGMWNALKLKHDEEIDMSQSFYVGDAAGREKPKDHSCCDRLFAINLGLKFYTPEEYFLKANPEPYKLPEFDPKTVTGNGYPEVNGSKLEAIIMVGYQGSGKSHYCKTQLIPKGYVHISRDILKSWQKCAMVMEEHLKKKQSVVIDNTNPDRKSRKHFIDVAQKLGVECRCFLMKVSIKHAKHNNRFRELTDKSHTPITEMIFNIFQKDFEPPTLDEGFKEIVEVPFVPNFKNAEEETLYRMYLLEK